MLRTLILTVAALMVALGHAAAQMSTGGTIRGYVKDEQRAVLPGVTVTATSADAVGTRSVVTDNEGYYRLLELAPGKYTITAELQGFATVRRDDIFVRAGLNLMLDIDMKIGTVSETVEVKADTPLLETSKAVQAVNVSGELQQSLPLSAANHWSDFVRLAPGAVAQDTMNDQASVFYVHGSSSVSVTTLIDGADLSSAVNTWTGFLAFPEAAIADTQIQTSGYDASAPLGMGAAANLALNAGTNLVRGSASIAYTPQGWVAVNTPGATSGSMTVTQPEFSVGGPIKRDRLWYFGSYRRRISTMGLSRPADQVAAMEALDPGFVPFGNDVRANILLLKGTAQLTPSHHLSTFYNYDATTKEANTSFYTGNFTQVVTGGSGASARLTSAWKDWLTSRVTLSWNNKSLTRMFALGADTPNPSRPVYRTAFASAGRLVGSTQLATLDNMVDGLDSPYSKWTVAGDVMMYRTGWIGSHEIQMGVYLQPNMKRLDFKEYANGGFVLEELVLVDPANPAGGTIPFHRQYYDASSATAALGHFSDNAAYIQDAWRPTPRVTVTAGLRFDYIVRHDDLYGMELQRSTEIGPRVGVNYVVTSDHRNAVRASFMRVHEPPSNNPLSANGAGAQGSGVQPVGLRDLYDRNLDGVFETVFLTPASSPLNPARVLDSAYHQPFVDEWTVGYRRQLPGAVSLDVGFIYRAYRDRTAFVEQNGIYTDGVFQGYQNVNLNEIYLVTPDRWNWPVYTAFEIVGTKHSSRLDVIGSYTRVFSHMAGTWQPNDPASFIQPDAFPNDKGLPNNAVSAGALNNGYSVGPGDPTWTTDLVHAAVAYRAPWNLVFAASYNLNKGLWSGPILMRIAQPDPQFGPPTVTLSNGRVVSNPLATTIRFANATQGDGQYVLPGTHYLNLRVGWLYRLSPSRRLEVNLDVLNLPNAAGYQGFLAGANQLYSANYGKGGNPQPPRALQLNLRFVF